MAVFTHHLHGGTSPTTNPVQSSPGMIRLWIIVYAHSRSQFPRATAVTGCVNETKIQVEGGKKLPVSSCW